VDSPRVSLAPIDGDGYLGVIEREGLVALVDQGLGRFLQHVQLEPAVANGKFGGFRVASLDPAWKGAGIESGDVITRLNGQPIERPEQAMAAFESLRTASEVKVEFTRAGTPANLRFRIE
jgi:type II secretory pathway component PulC